MFNSTALRYQHFLFNFSRFSSGPVFAVHLHSQSGGASCVTNNPSEVRRIFLGAKNNLTEWRPSTLVSSRCFAVFIPTYPIERSDNLPCGSVSKHCLMQTLLSIKDPPQRLRMGHGLWSLVGCTLSLPWSLPWEWNLMMLSTSMPTRGK